MPESSPEIVETPSESIRLKVSSWPSAVKVPLRLVGVGKNDWLTVTETGPRFTFWNRNPPCALVCTRCDTPCARPQYSWSK